MIKILANLRHGALIAVLSLFAASIFMLYLGALKVYKAIIGYITNTGNIILEGTTAEKVITHVSQADAAIGRIIESIDAFLIALVLMYTGYGILAIFCDNDGYYAKQLPAAIVPKNIGQLKETIVQLILVILLVLFMRNIWFALNDLNWELLVLPISVALIALTLKLANLSKGHD